MERNLSFNYNKGVKHNFSVCSFSKLALKERGWQLDKTSSINLLQKPRNLSELELLSGTKEMLQVKSEDGIGRLAG
jgi:hypothetical protein